MDEPTPDVPDYDFPVLILGGSCESWHPEGCAIEARHIHLTSGRVIYVDDVKERVK